MIVVCASITLSIFARYIVLALVAQWGAGLLGLCKIFEFKKPVAARRREIILSCYSSVVFGIGFTGLFYLWKLGALAITIDEQPLLVHFRNILLVLVIQDTYYYWVHRAMHSKKLFPILHRGHHESVEVSSWTSFSFDPLESVIQFIPICVIALLIPLHIYGLIIILAFMSMTSVLNHLNYDITPKFLATKFPSFCVIGPRHHALHHKEFRTNFGLYFTIWDKIAGTSSRSLEQEQALAAKKG